MSSAPSPLEEIALRVAGLYHVQPAALAASTGQTLANRARQDVLLLMRLTTRASYRGLGKRFDRRPDQVQADVDAAVMRCLANDRHAAALLRVLIGVDQAQPRITEEVPHGSEPDRPPVAFGRPVMPAASSARRPRLSLKTA